MLQGETKVNRLKRFEEGPPQEVIDTTLNSIHSFFNTEIRATFADKTRSQTSLMVLGIHAVALTIAYGFFNEHGKKGFTSFLINFVDGDTPDTAFSTIAAEIHEWRNVIAHRWINVAGHSFSYDCEMKEGWRRDEKGVFLNPQIYLEHYLNAFGGGGKIYNYEQILSDNDMQSAKRRFIDKYEQEA
jgi:hypothetical protein